MVIKSVKVCVNSFKYRSNAVNVCGFVTGSNGFEYPQNSRDSSLLASLDLKQALNVQN